MFLTLILTLTLAPTPIQERCVWGVVESVWMNGDVDVRCLRCPPSPPDAPPWLAAPESPKAFRSTASLVPVPVDTHTLAAVCAPLLGLPAYPDRSKTRIEDLPLQRVLDAARSHLGLGWGMADRSGEEVLQEVARQLNATIPQVYAPPPIQQFHRYDLSTEASDRDEIALKGYDVASLTALHTPLYACGCNCFHASQFPQVPLHPPGKWSATAQRSRVPNRPVQHRQVQHSASRRSVLSRRVDRGASSCLSLPLCHHTLSALTRTPHTHI